jgi:DNA-directed RNA polymerase subunit M/transcription elongation factor TFIIS
MKFCQYCQNVNEPDQLKTTTNELVFVCKSCRTEVIENDIKEFKIVTDSYNETKDRDNLLHILDDITVPLRKMKCKVASCDNNYIKYIVEGENMEVTYICGKCKNFYK